MKMSVVKVPVTMSVPKESKELVDALAAVVIHLKTHGFSPKDAEKLLGPVYEGVKGVDQLDDEMKSDGNDEAAGYLIHKIWGAFKGEGAAAA